MHENAPILTAKKRERIGSRYANRVRQQGGLPAIIYGHKEEPTPIALDARETINHILKGEKVFRIQMDGNGEAQTVLLKDVQYDYMGTKVVHCDLARVSLTDRVHVTVPVRLVGDAVGLKTAGAILLHPTGELEIECVVTEIPDHVEVSVTDLQVDQMITAGQVKLPSETMRLLTDGHAVVAQIVVQSGEATAEAATVEAGAAQPEVLTAKKKDEEGGAAKAAGGDKKKG